MSILLALPLYRLTDANNVIIPSGRLYSFLTGTTTPAATYTTSALSVSHGDYVQANSAGLLPPIYLDPTVSYRFQVRATPYASAVSGMDFDPVTAAGAASITFTQAGTGAVATTVEEWLQQLPVSILDFRATSDTTDTAAFQKALATDKPIYFPGGQGLGTAGVYLITTTAAGSGYLTANTRIFGDGIEKTVIRPAAAGQTVFRAKSSGSGTQIDNISLHDLTLYGYSASGFSEQIHLAAFNGVSNLLIERVFFKAPQGDAIYLGTGETPGEGRHNSSVTIQDCRFDGVNNANRAALSVIDCDGLHFRRNTVINFTTSTMPGAIDFEPDATDTTALLRNIRIDGNLFNACGGNVATIGFAVPSAVTALPRSVLISNNDFRNYAGTGAEFYIHTNRTLTAASDDMAIALTGNRGETGVVPFYLVSAKGVVIDQSNVFKTYTTNAVAGLGATEKLWDAYIAPRMFACGSITDARGIRVGTCDGVTLEPYFYKCGAASTTGTPLQFATGVTSNNVTIGPGLRIVANTSQVTGIDNEGGTHTFTSANNRISTSIDLGGLANEFVASAPGQVLPPVTFTWDPANLADGAGETSAAVTVTGAAFGDTVVFTAPYDLQGITLNAYVSASNTVKGRLQNETGGAIDLASGTWTATVTKKAVL